MIEIIKPELVLFFGSNNYIYYKVLIKKLFKKQPFKTDPCSKPESFKSISKEYTAHKRGDKDIKTTIAAGIIDTKPFKTKAIFIPHPNYPITDENRKKALKEICEWIKNPE